MNFDSFHKNKLKFQICMLEMANVRENDKYLFTIFFLISILDTPITYTYICSYFVTNNYDSKFQLNS